MKTSLLHTHRLLLSPTVPTEGDDPKSFSVLTQINAMIAAELDLNNDACSANDPNSTSAAAAPTPLPKPRRLQDVPALFADPFIAAHFGEERIEAHLKGGRLIPDAEIQAAYFKKANELAQHY